MLLIHFNPRSTHGVRPGRSMQLDTAVRFQSSLHSLGATLSDTCFLCNHQISIRAPLAGRDSFFSTGVLLHTIFLSALHSQGATVNKQIPSLSFIFQSTLHSLGATYRRRYRIDKRRNFNPRSTRWERQSGPSRCPSSFFISIHAPLAGSDGAIMPDSMIFGIFQSTLHSLGATTQDVLIGAIRLISIRAPLAGSDAS